MHESRNAAGAAAKLYVDAMEEVVGDKTEYCKYDELAVFLSCNRRLG